MISEFVKEKVFWTRKMNLKLVKFIENRPHVWNKQHPKYTSVQMKDQTFAEFAAEYGNEFSGQAVKDRWINIRTTFAHHLRKIKFNAEQNEEYKVKWHLWEACQFLRNASGTINSTDDNSIYNETELSYDSDYRDDCKLNKAEENSEMEFNMTDTSIKDTYNCKNFAEQLLQVFKGVQNDAFGLNNSKHAKVGKAVTKKLRSLNSYEAAKLCQEIMQILLLYDKHNPNNPNNDIKLEIN